MATRKEFCEAMNDVWRNHGIYIGTANGELTEELTIGKIRQMEINYGHNAATTKKNIRRDFAYIGKCYENGWDMSLSAAGDCSGQIVGVMRKLGIIKPTADYSAKMFQSKAKPIALDSLQPADLVFDKTSSASHVGVYIGDGMVVESKGRDDGVVKRKVNEGGWVIGGRLDWFDPEIIPELTRNLYYREGDLMRGEDVGMAQERLKLHSCDPGKIDGIFGYKTREAVMKFQIANELTADGIVGQKTWNTLWS